MNARSDRGSLGELAGLFLKLGTVGFGPAETQITRMKEEVVTHRGWMPQSRFLDAVETLRLIPGSSAAKTAAHLGFLRSGWQGLLLAGLCYVLPSVLLTCLLAWVYLHFGAMPQVAPILFGIKPAMLGVMAGAVWRSGRRAFKDWRLGFTGAAVTLVALADLAVVVALSGGALLGMFWSRTAREYGPGGGAAGALVVPVAALALSVAKEVTPMGVSLPALGGFFLKVGSVLYGSEYLLVAFLQEGPVEFFGWLTEAQVLEAIAIARLAPGPFCSSAAFIGFLATGGGLGGAFVASAAALFPGFFFIAVLNPFLPRLRQSVWVAAFVDAVTVCALGLVVAVAIKLSWVSLTSVPAIGVAVLAGVLSIWRQVGAAWLILGGGAVGWIWVALGLGG